MNLCTLNDVVLCQIKTIHGLNVCSYISYQQNINFPRTVEQWNILPKLSIATRENFWWKSKEFPLKYFILLQKLHYKLFILFVLQQNAVAYNILFLVPFPGPSHYIFIGNFIKELIARGHDVTSITNFKLSENSTKYKEILIDPRYDLSEHGKNDENARAKACLVNFFSFSFVVSSLSNESLSIGLWFSVHYRTLWYGNQEWYSWIERQKSTRIDPSKRCPFRFDHIGTIFPRELADVQ